MRYPRQRQQTGEGLNSHITDKTEHNVLIGIGVLLLAGGAILTFSGLFSIVGVPMMAAGLVVLARALV